MDNIKILASTYDDKNYVLDEVEVIDAISTFCNPIYDLGAFYGDLETDLDGLWEKMNKAREEKEKKFEMEDWLVENGFEEATYYFDEFVEVDNDDMRLSRVYYICETDEFEILDNIEVVKIHEYLDVGSNWKKIQLDSIEEIEVVDELDLDTWENGSYYFVSPGHHAKVYRDQEKNHYFIHEFDFQGSIPIWERIDSVKEFVEERGLEDEFEVKEFFKLNFCIIATEFEDVNEIVTTEIQDHEKVYSVFDYLDEKIKPLVQKEDKVEEYFLCQYDQDEEIVKCWKLCFLEDAEEILEFYK